MSMHGWGDETGPKCACDECQESEFPVQEEADGERRMKTVTLGFRVPADVDTPSEVLARMKTILLDALILHVEAGCRFKGEDRALVDALLTES